MIDFICLSMVIIWVIVLVIWANGQRHKTWPLGTRVVTVWGSVGTIVGSKWSKGWATYSVRLDDSRYTVASEMNLTPITKTGSD